MKKGTAELSRPPFVLYAAAIFFIGGSLVYGLYADIFGSTFLYGAIFILWITAIITIHYLKNGMDAIKAYPEHYAFSNLSTAWYQIRFDRYLHAIRFSRLFFMLPQGNWDHCNELLRMLQTLHADDILKKVERTAYLHERLQILKDALCIYSYGEFPQFFSMAISIVKEVLKELKIQIANEKTNIIALKAYRPETTGDSGLTEQVKDRLDEVTQRVVKLTEYIQRSEQALVELEARDAAEALTQLSHISI